HFFRHRIRLENGEIGDQSGRTFRLHSELASAVAARYVTDRSDEIELVDEAPLALRHDNEDLAARGRDLRRTAATRQPDFRFVIGSDHCRVQIGELVDLRTTEKADLDAATLQPVTEHFR